MEVHHHSHTDPAHGGTSRKKFTHYLWEFLMLFLAVFCGFLAENQREHLIEHQREQQYMRSMVKDLEQDETNIQKSIIDETRTIQIADSLIEMFQGIIIKIKQVSFIILPGILQLFPICFT